MGQSATDHLRHIWKQDKIPVLVRKGKGYKLRVKIPHLGEIFEDQRIDCALLQEDRQKVHQPEWLDRYKGWEVAQE